MNRYIITGTSGAGKTSIISLLENMGYGVAHEAATDVIAHEQSMGIEMPWREDGFIDKVVILQKQRQIRLSSKVQFFDRAPFDEDAFCRYMNYSLSPILLEEIRRITVEGVYQKKVFFIENLGFCEPTAVRQISFEEALKFEKIHEEVYRSYGFELIKIAPDTIEERVDRILSLI
jgi:predicted ATPase